MSSPTQPATQIGHTAEDRAALFDDMHAKIMRRDAFVSVKNERLNLDIDADMHAQRDAFVHAETDEELILAIMRMSNARKDAHVKVWLVPDGLELPGIDVPADGVRMDRLPVAQAPLRLTVDYGDPEARFFFVGDIADETLQYCDTPPDIGDRLLAVNGVEIADYLERLDPYLRWSTYESLWWRRAYALTQKSPEIPPDLYRDQVEYRLQRADGTLYDITLPYFVDDVAISWHGHFRRQGQPRYPGFTRQASRPCFDLYLADDAKIVLLDWARFGEDHVVADTDFLMDWAAKRGVTDHAVIFDGTRGRGGGYGAYVLQALTSKPFTATFGNLRLSDIVEPFIDLIHRGRTEGASLKEVDAGVWMDDGSWLWDWLVNDVRADMAAGKEYSANVPFKLTHLPKTSDGRVSPHPVHFEGPFVAMFGPAGGSHLDQFAAMVADNQLGETIGMSTAGFSNTWEWVEQINFPTTGRPAVGMMWSMGHTVRPNGELLDGNPPVVSNYIPQTRENFARYPELLLSRAVASIS